MEKEPELISFEAVTRCSVRVQKVLMVFDEVLHPASGAVDGIIDNRRPEAFQAGYHEPKILPLR